MFIGHYGPSFAAKAWKNPIPLWVLFLAVQLVDIFWSIFVILGIEKVRIVPGITATNPFDLYYMPYTHSLIAAVLWSAVAAVAYRFFSPGRWMACGRDRRRRRILALDTRFACPSPRPAFVRRHAKGRIRIVELSGPGLRSGDRASVRRHRPLSQGDKTERQCRPLRHDDFWIDHCGGTSLHLLRPAAGFGQGCRGHCSGELFAFAAIAYWLERRRS